ncbi:MAG: 1-(5-phosphoribosyl)-5-[(5-phosphoribosylamino)methylideneamino] imidazole-4-carboxamide isomerase [Acidimicrobiia bacterium]|nr:1-(5-phosphoribosyl)-5-[(5-phosphoribosylamino)methylideneamino] imidazole-4-carboxamide isomerase [Acidimicrobiia bacterium]NNL28766.1 1-(5-phosphoribosyl)-5-[(5-phosphoribosylamino)methylideneamino] imidazole-4-carboxamide isomerase [Acidimicrobiia bacterium]
MFIFPAVDVLDGKVVRLHRGSYDAVTVYHDDPVETAQLWIERGAAMVHVVDLEGAKAGVPSPALWRAMAEGGVRFQVGGGLRTASSVDRALAAGATRVVMGTAAVHDVALIGRLVSNHGSDAIAVSIDIRDGEAQGSGWLAAGRPWQEVVAELLHVGVTWMVTTAIARDGTMEGPDGELVAAVVAAAPDALVVAAGGISSNSDIEHLARLGASGAIVGRALYEGAVDFLA